MGRGEPARGSTSRSLVPSRLTLPGERRAFALAATEDTGERDSPPEEDGFEPLVPRKKDGVFRDDLIDRRPLLLPENQATPSREGPRVRIPLTLPASPVPAVSGMHDQRRAHASLSRLAPPASGRSGRAVFVGDADSSMDSDPGFRVSYTAAGGGRLTCCRPSQFKCRARYLETLS